MNNESRIVAPPPFCVLVSLCPCVLLFKFYLLSDSLLSNQNFEYLQVQWFTKIEGSSTCLSF